MYFNQIIKVCFLITIYLIFVGQVTFWRQWTKQTFFCRFFLAFLAFFATLDRQQSSHAQFFNSLSNNNDSFINFLFTLSLEAWFCVFVYKHATKKGKMCQDLQSVLQSVTDQDIQWMSPMMKGKWVSHEEISLERSHH